MRGNFSRFQRTLDKLENISTSNIRNLINRGDELAVNSRFLMERAGATGQQDDDMLDHHSDVEDPMSVQ
jgi:hypothetical protein